MPDSIPVVKESLSCTEPGRILDEMKDARPIPTAPRSMKTLSLRDLSKQRVAEDLKRAGKVRVRTAHGSMVVMDGTYYESWVATIGLLMRPDWHQLWAQSELELATGRGRDLEEVLGELGREGAAQRKRGAAASRSPGRRAAQGVSSSPKSRSRAAKRNPVSR